MNRIVDKIISIVVLWTSIPSIRDVFLYKSEEYRGGWGARTAGGGWSVWEEERLPGPHAVHTVHLCHQLPESGCPGPLETSCHITINVLVQVLKAKNAFLKALTVRHLTEEDYRRRGEVGNISYQTYRNSTLFHHTFHSTFGFHFWLPPGQMEGNILGLPANFSPGWWLWLLKSLCQEEEECDDDDLVHRSSQWTSSSTSTSTSTKIQWNTFSTKSSSSSSSSS